MKRKSFTKKEQLTICKKALEILNEEKYECLCYCIIDAIIATYGHDSLQFKIFSNNLELSCIPLLQNKKPKKCQNIYWWNLDEKGYKKRMKALKDTIKELKIK